MAIITTTSPLLLHPSKPHHQLSSFLHKNPPRLPKTRLNSTISLYTTSSTSSSPPSSAPPQQVQTFWQWLTDKGVITPKTPVKPAMVPEGLGLVAQRNISRNEVVLEIPNRLWINPDTVAGSDIGNLCSGLKPWVSVALFLVREKLRKDSAWRVYLDVLPTSTDSTVFWSEQELAELQGSQLLSTTSGVKELVKNEFSKVEEEIIVPNKKLFPSPITFDDFLWAFGILRSRSFSRLRGQNLVLVPLADLINHNPRITTEDYAYEIKGAGFFSKDLLFSLRSPIDVKAGEQVGYPSIFHTTTLSYFDTKNAFFGVSMGHIRTLEWKRDFDYRLARH